MIDNEMFSVSEACLVINEFFTSNFYDILIYGEISQINDKSGHQYLTIKDNDASLSVAIFRFVRMKIKENFVVGDEIIVKGKFNLYAPTGRLTFIASDAYLKGQGIINNNLKKLFEKLKGEGLFSQPKKKIPLYPRKIVIITSESGAAIHDIIATLDSRFPVEKILIKASVQGENSAKELLAAFVSACAIKPDVIIIGRGGGSKDDLNCFNDEALVRTIASSPVPVISAVGHQIDVTLIDYVSDMKAITPTEAAVFATPRSESEIQQEIMTCVDRLNYFMNKEVKTSETKLIALISRPVLSSPKVLVLVKEEKVEILKRALLAGRNNLLNRLKMQQEKLLHEENRINKATMVLLNKHESELEKYHLVLESFDPFKVLERGYSISTKNDIIIKSINDVKTDDTVMIKVSDGSIKTKVITKEGK